MPWYQRAQARRPSNSHASQPTTPASLPQTCHDSPRPCHDTVPQQVLGTNQAKQEQRASKQRNAMIQDGHHQWWSTTTPTGVGGEWKRKVLEAERAPPSMEVKAAAEAPWMARATARSGH
ncbi:hypothetical protein CJ030_MR7G017428 [Morella rubra]|uniref:Uncharacterized protein n=1 Tax=Morella rubra TaxID=262757 RepID=A0A6A1V3T6_9ROSI|nr:hypothetical protein CJ030_MR7G017428 [Morella rubra]